MGIFTVLAFIFLVVCILAGKAALPGNPVLLVCVVFFSNQLVQLFGLEKYACGWGKVVH